MVLYYPQYKSRFDKTPKKEEEIKTIIGAGFTEIKPTSDKNKNVSILPLGEINANDKVMKEKLKRFVNFKF